MPARTVAGSVAATAATAVAAVAAVRMSRRNPGRGDARAGEEADVDTCGPFATMVARVPPSPTTPLGRVAAYAWAAPLTAAGAVLALLSGGRPAARDGVVVVAAARGPVGAMLSRRGFSATTLGHVVITVADEPSAALLAHELAHTRQAERLGVAFGPLYVGLLARYGYRRHPMERAARQAAGAG